MTSKQYCFDIQNSSNEEIDVDMLKYFIQKLYVGKKKNQFTKDETPPFVVIHTKSDNNVCILMTSKGKKNIERIEEINSTIKPSDLKFTDTVYLTKPYEFNVEVVQWWDNMPKTSKKWSSLSHNGPYFVDILEPYQPLRASLIYEGKKYPLTTAEEKVASFYAKRKISENSGNVVDLWTEDKTFNTNYWNDFKTYLTYGNKKIFKDFYKIGWSDLIAKIEASKTTLDDYEKKMKKIKTEEKKREYGYATLDGKKEKIGNFTIEPQTIFIGRGDNPNRGKIKKQIYPEDVTINIGESDPVPEPPDGHSWGAIVHDKNAVWLSKWNDSITGDTKYILFSAEGRFKGESDLAKYDKARKMELYIDSIREKYMKDASSKNLIEMQLGTVLFLIDNYGVRVGNEKDENEADTVGATTLRVDNVNLDNKNHVIFDFLGKDSIRFYKDIEVPSLIYNNFVKLVSNKKKSDQIFDSVSSTSINTYLKEFDKSFSAKVFRTRLASLIMFDALKTVKIPAKSTKAQTKVLFNKANAKVADVLNHTRNVSKKAQESVKQFKEDLKVLEKEVKALKKEKKSTTTLESRIEKLKTKIESKTDVMAVAINTSLTNYIDPRLIVSWSKKQNVDLSAIYTTTLLRKFQWAVDTTDLDWNWKSSPMIDQKLDSLDEGTAVIVSLQEEKPIKPTKPTKSTKPTKPTTKPTTKVPTQPQRIEKLPVGTTDDYKLLLSICKDPVKNRKNFVNISKHAMDWIYPFSKYFVDNSINVIANNYIVKFYEAAYKK